MSDNIVKTRLHPDGDDSTTLYPETSTDQVQGLTALIKKLGAGFTPRGEWMSAVAYEVDDVVSYSGNSYIARNAVTSATPPPSDTDNWQISGGQGPEGPQGPQGEPGEGTPLHKYSISIGVQNGGNRSDLTFLCYGDFITPIDTTPPTDFDIPGFANALSSIGASKINPVIVSGYVTRESTGSGIPMAIYPDGDRLYCGWVETSIMSIAEAYANGGEILRKSIIKIF